MNYDESMLGRRMKLLMAARGMTQGQLADQCGINDATISAYVNGSMTPGIDKVWRIAEALGVTPNELCGWSELTGEMLDEKSRRQITSGAAQSAAANAAASPYAEVDRFAGAAKHTVAPLLAPAV